jgi:putative addiction module component (TIGR02574 family)
MTDLAQSILNQALALPLEDRADVADRLIESIGPPGEDLSAEEWHAAVVAELESRQAAMDAGEMETYSWEEVEARAKNRIREWQKESV